MYVKVSSPLSRLEAESVTLGSVTQGEGDIYEILKVVKHPQYDDTDLPYKNDLAIITLKENIAFKGHVNYICLPKYREIFYEQEAIVAGESMSLGNLKSA